MDGRLLEYLYGSRDKETALIEAMWMIEKCIYVQQCIYVQPHAGVSTAREHGSNCSDAGTFASFAQSGIELFLVSFLNSGNFPQEDLQKSASTRVADSKI